MSQKINWKLLAKESSVLVAHTLLFGFYLRISLVLFDYYRSPVLASLALIASLFFAFPLLISFLDLWARSIGAIREEALAEKMLKVSVTVHEKIFGKKNAYMAEKQAILASLYYDQGKTTEADTLFKEAWEIYKKSALKLPWMHSCFADYLTLLNTAGDTETAGQVNSALKASNNLLLVQKLSIVLVTVPIITFLMLNQTLERSITKHNMHGEILLALKEVTTLAHNEARILGEYAAAKVYSDYAQAFSDTEAQINEMEWCADKALYSLSRSGKKDEYLEVLLLNLKAKASLADGKPDEALKNLQEAAFISIHWDKEQLSQHKFQAALERDKALLELAELDRNRGRYPQAEVLYKKVLDDSDIFQKVKIALLDPMEIVDRLHKFQHIEMKLGKNDQVLKLQERVCQIMEASVKGLVNNTSGSAVCDFGVREASRELDICALMLQDAGKSKEAKDYQARADYLRNLHQKALKLNAGEQDSIVDATTRVTNDLLSVKYRAGDWQQALNHLLNDELRSKKARGAFEHLPWYDANNIKTASQVKASTPDRTLSVDIEPLSIRTNRAGEGISVDVQGTVKIINAKSKKSEDEQKFGFAYVLKAQNSGQHSVEDLLDNQALAHIQFD